jgi:hypothetical protein
MTNWQHSSARVLSNNPEGDWDLSTEAAPASSNIAQHVRSLTGIVGWDFEVASASIREFKDAISITDELEYYNYNPRFRAPYDYRHSSERWLSGSHLILAPKSLHDLAPLLLGATSRADTRASTQRPRRWRRLLSSRGDAPTLHLRYIALELLIDVAPVFFFGLTIFLCSLLSALVAGHLYLYSIPVFIAILCSVAAAFVCLGLRKLADKAVNT